MLNWYDRCCLCRNVCLIVSGNMTRSPALRLVGFVGVELSVGFTSLAPLHLGQFGHPKNRPYRPLFSRISAPHFGHFIVVVSLDCQSPRLGFVLILLYGFTGQGLQRRCRCFLVIDTVTTMRTYHPHRFTRLSMFSSSACASTCLSSLVFDASSPDQSDHRCH